MAFTENNKLGKGRPKGSVNISTGQIREAIQLIVEDNIQQIERDLVALEPRDRVKFFIDLASFVLPRLKATEQTIIDAKEGVNPITISFLE